MFGGRGGPGCGERRVHSCAKCQSNVKMPAQAPLHPWEWPEQSWAQVHAGNVSPIQGKMFLVMVNAQSKWLELHMMQSAISLMTTEKMHSVFATHGLPEMLVTDVALYSPVRSSIN